ncbi:MAG TPA: hypothetical protein VI451_11805 [Anaerolineales bacterium]|nr:hypothetical protein [Anaerolineales bacterium]
MTEQNYDLFISYAKVCAIASISIDNVDIALFRDDNIVWVRLFYPWLFAFA